MGNCMDNITLGNLTLGKYTLVTFTLGNLALSLGNHPPGTRLSTDWITLRVHDVGKNLALIFLIVTTSIFVSK